MLGGVDEAVSDGEHTSDVMYTMCGFQESPGAQGPPWEDKGLTPLNPQE